MLETLHELVSKVEIQNCVDDCGDMAGVIEQIAIHANELHVAEHEASLESLRLKSQISQLSQSVSGKNLQQI